MFWIAAETGMRGGELCGLFADDVDLANRLIYVRRSAWRGKLQTPKTSNAVRHFPISPNLAQHIQEHLAGRTSGLLFHTRNGKPYDNYNVVTWQLKPLLTKVGIQGDAAKGMGLHAFRHGNASALDSVGAPVRVRMDRLGHADSEMTLGYTHAVSEDHRRVADEMGRIFDPSLPKLSVTDRNVRTPLLNSVGA
ncbi:MAG TPA: site-specific integrase [Terriglobales bacterium]|nr:site-specific integrase [Terriglobales bacterium]